MTEEEKKNAWLVDVLDARKAMEKAIEQEVSQKVHPMFSVSTRDLLLQSMRHLQSALSKLDPALPHQSLMEYLEVLEKRVRALENQSRGTV